jgi:hypothetical protein
MEWDIYTGGQSLFSPNNQSVVLFFFSLFPFLSVFSTVSNASIGQSWATRDVWDWVFYVLMFDEKRKTGKG